MKPHPLILFLILALGPVLASAQLPGQIILKTKPVNFVVAQNPSFEIEKVLNKRFSLSLDLVWRRQTLVASGAEGPVGRFHPSNGFKIGLIPRYYFSTKRDAPFGWFVSGLLRYNFVVVNNVVIESYKSDYIKTVNYTSRGLQGGILLGRQFKLGRFTTDLSFGLTIYGENYEEVITAQNPNRLPETAENYRRNDVQPYLGWTVGYHFNKHRSETVSQ